MSVYEHDEDELEEDDEQYEDEEEYEEYGEYEPDSGYKDPQPYSREGLCVSCGARPVDLSDSSYSKLCYGCRQQQITLKIPAKIKVFLAFACAVFLFSLITFIPVLSNYSDYLAAERHMRAREYTFAFEKYTPLLERYGYSVPLTMKASQAAMSAQYFGDLAEIFDNYIVGKNLDDNQYAVAMMYSDFLDVYIDTWLEIDSIYAEAYDVFGEDGDPLDFMAFISVKLEAMLERRDVDRTYILYTLANMTPDIETRVAILRLSIEQDLRCTYTYSYYGNALRRIGDFDLARDILRYATEINATDALSWRGLGVLCLLEGQNSEGLELARHAFAIDPYGLFIADSLIVALCENGLRDEAMATLDLFIADGFHVDDDLQQYLSGEIDLVLYYMG